MTCGFGCGSCVFSRPRPAGDEWDLWSLPLDLSLLPYEIPPVSCFLWRFLMTFLLGRSASLGVVYSLSPAVFFLWLYYTTAPGIRLFADMPTMQRKICAVSSLPLRAKNGIINMLGCCTAQTVRCPFWQGTAFFWRDCAVVLRADLNRH